MCAFLDSDRRCYVKCYQKNPQPPNNNPLIQNRQTYNLFWMQVVSPWIQAHLGPRCIIKYLQFSLQVDSFLVEAVSLSHLQKVIIGHDGQGYGAGMYLKMVTVRESQDSDKEWVFPCWNWLDTHLGLCETICEIFTVGKLFCNLAWLSVPFEFDCRSLQWFCKWKMWIFSFIWLL